MKWLGHALAGILGAVVAVVALRFLEASPSPAPAELAAERDAVHDLRILSPPGCASMPRSEFTAAGVSNVFALR